jgi:hypothetical protein
MTTEALPSVRLDRFERRLRIGLILAFVGIAALLVWLGVWLERPFRALPVEGQTSAQSSAEAALAKETSR